MSKRRKEDRSSTPASAPAEAFGGNVWVLIVGVFSWAATETNHPARGGGGGGRGMGKEAIEGGHGRKSNDRALVPEELSSRHNTGEDAATPVNEEC